jgi:SAM-dependent methyltransferase
LTTPLDTRIPEPELMDSPAQALAYASADFADVNSRFVERFVGAFPEFTRGDLVDLGCGPADISLRLARAVPACRVAAVDGSLPMLALAREAAREAGQQSRVAAIAGRVPSLPFESSCFDAVVSNSLFHHLADPDRGWAEVRRIARRGAPLFVMDLFRPATREDAARIVDEAARHEPEILRSDFYNSLCAAFRVEEVRAQLARAGLGGCRCEIVSERHWLVHGRVR